MESSTLSEECSDRGSEQPLPSSDNNLATKVGSLSLSGGEQSAHDKDSPSAEAFWQNRQILLRNDSTNFRNSLRQEDVREGNARRFHSVAEQLPYLPADIRAAVKQIAHLLANQIGHLPATNHDSHVGEHLSDGHLHMLNGISDLVVRETVRKTFLQQLQKESQLSQLLQKGSQLLQKESIASLMNMINNHVIDTTAATIRVANQL